MNREPQAHNAETAKDKRWSREEALLVRIFNT